jgi:glycine cleavage system H protein
MKLFTKDHEWVDFVGTVGIVGITDHAQHSLGDITFVELPTVGTVLKQGDEACAIESAKAASSVFAPLSGSVVEVNPLLDENPALVNISPEDEGWIYKLELSVPGEEVSLMNLEDYQAYLEA